MTNEEIAVRLEGVTSRLEDLLTDDDHFDELSDIISSYARGKIGMRKAWTKTLRIIYRALREQINLKWRIKDTIAALKTITAEPGGNE